MGTVTIGSKTYTYIEPKDKSLNEWPCVFLYHYASPFGDQYSSTPLHNGKPWKLLIFDLKEYEKLASQGKIYQPSHTGIEPQLTDRGLSS